MELKKSINYPATPDQVAALSLNPDFMKARIARAGLNNAVVEGGDGRVRATITVDASDLPSKVAKFVPKGISVVLEETWAQDANGTWNGTTNIDPGKAPVEARATSTLVANGDSTLREVNAVVKVSIPLIGGRIESEVASRIDALLSVEESLAAEWLAKA